MMDDYIKILESEFTGSKESFYWDLRANLNWNYKRFTVLIKAMEECCKNMETEDNLPRWLTEGFYSTYRFVKTIVPHKKDEIDLPGEYYNKVVRRLDDLCHWLYTGRRPYLTIEDVDKMRGYGEGNPLNHLQDPLSEDL